MRVSEGPSLPGLRESARASARMWAGPVPQHPPTIVAPARTHASASAA